jgi:predicted DNA-binding transcriptional regulator YafY
VKVLAKYLNSKTISFKYTQGYENEMKITMHPHLLKEYNSRWFLFGYVQEDDKWKIVNFALDRIVYKGKNDIKADFGCKKAPRGYYENYFKDIVGVTHPDGGQMEVIVIHTTDFKVHQLIKTKPIHSSQEEVRQFDMERGQGEFTIHVVPNIELRTRLLSYGPGIYVTGDGQFPQQMRKAVSEMAEKYGLAPR